MSNLTDSQRAELSRLVEEGKITSDTFEAFLQNPGGFTVSPTKDGIVVPVICGDGSISCIRLAWVWGAWRWRIHISRL